MRPGRNLLCFRLFGALAIMSLGCSGDDGGLRILSTCGNASLEAGEECDPGGTCNDGSDCLVGIENACPAGVCVPKDTEACSSICTRPVCGDGLAQGGLEQCDTFDLRNTSCADFGRAENPEGGPSGGLVCLDSCTLDASGCGGVFTPTPLPTSTPTNTVTPATQLPTPTVTNTPTATATPTPPCNLPIIEPGEFFDDPENGIVGTPDGTECPEDAEVLTCEPSEERASFDVLLLPPLGGVPTSTSMLVGYRSDQVNIGDRDRDALEDIGPSSTVFSFRDFDYAVRLVWTGTNPLDDAEGTPLVRINFALCTDATLPDLTSVACSIEGCSGLGGPLEGCACELRVAASQ